ncbi:MAG: hypothetical protein AAGG51_17150 [Cyanobacteria bacterium P01_G01_bin.54]
MMLPIAESSAEAVAFTPNQIVCLERDGVALYAEVIQMIPERQRCWVRPRWLVCPEQVYVLDDRAPDLVWPSADFRLAFDLEVLPLTGELSTSSRATAGRQQLQQWLRRWHSTQGN